MKRILFLLVLVSVTCVGVQAQIDTPNGHVISITVSGWQDSIAYLGYYVNKNTYLQDTAKVVDSKVVFEGEDELTPGLYFVYTPNNLFFEFIVSDQQFSLRTDINDINGSMSVENSEENKYFYAYQKKMISFQKEAKLIQENKENLDSLERTNALREINKSVKDYQLQQRNQHAGSYFSEFLSLIIRPDVQVPEGLSEEKAQSYRFREYKRLFWEGTNFQNPGTVRNPMLGTKLEEYFEKLVYRQADSVTAELDQFLSQEMDSTVYRYFVVTLTNKYATSKVMGMDAVYVHMIDNYYATGKAYWIDDTTLTRMKQNSDRLRKILIGEKAPLFLSETISGEVVKDPFSTTNEDYKIIFFYDSGCGHCKKAAPKLMKAFHSLQDEKVSVELITMNFSDDIEEWKVFIKTYGLEGQILGDTKGVSNAGYYYYVDSTPQIFIVDKKNNIIAKKIGAEFVDDFLADYSKLKQ